MKYYLKRTFWAWMYRLGFWDATPKGNGSTDDTASIQARLDVDGYAELSNGKYPISGLVLESEGIYVHGKEEEGAV